MKNTIYKVQFFDGRTGDWKDVPTRPNMTTLVEAKNFMKAQYEMCHYTVDFRIKEV